MTARRPPSRWLRARPRRAGHARRPDRRRSAGGGIAARQHGALRDVQRVAQPQRRGPVDPGPRHAEQRPGGERRGGHPAGAPGRAADQRVRLRRRRAWPWRASRTTTCRCRTTARPPIDYPYAFTAPSNTGIAVRLRPEQQRRSGHDAGALATATTPSASALPGPVRDGGLLDVPDRPTRRSARSRTSSGRTCRALPEMPPRWTGTPRRSRPCCPCRPRATGTCRSRSASAPCTSWSATRRRRCSTAPRTATAGATSTRSGCGPTTSRRARAATSTTTRAARGGLAPGESFVIAGDQNSDPLDGDSIPGSIQQLIDNPRRQHVAHAGERRCRRGVGAAGRGQPDAPLRPEVRHGGLRRLRTRATCARTTCCRAATCGSGTRGCSGRSRPTRCSG